jgi:dihydropteroate synthase
MINDISAGSMDQQLLETVGKLGVPYVLMHMKGKPQNMAQQSNYDDLITEVMDFLIEKVGTLRDLGIKDIIIDPGFGFGKTIQHNFQLLKNLHVFAILECLLLAGVSRKSFIYKTLKINAEDALNGTTALHMIALEQGANILRVHDVQAAVQAIKLWSAMKDA